MPVTLCYNEISRFFYSVENGRGTKEENFCMECPTIEFADRIAKMIYDSFILDHKKRQVHLSEVRRICRSVSAFIKWHDSKVKQNVLF